MISHTENAFFQNKLERAVFVSLEKFEDKPDFEKAKSWLLEVGSLTKRFEQTQALVTVVPHVEKFIRADETIQRIVMADSPIFWQRDITLYGNGEPWLIARTLVPRGALLDDYNRLVDLGTVPLGKYLFSQKSLQRTQFDIAELIFDEHSLSYALREKICRDGISYRQSELDPIKIKLWARRSILTINQSKLILTELFLPSSPIYVP